MADELERDEPQRDGQFSAHNKTPRNDRKIRMSWIVIVLIVVVLAVTAMWLQTAAH
jgi:hypothetical protein